jgi:hypothetical protein
MVKKQPIVKAAPPHKGKRTQNQDQLIKFVSLRPIKRMVSIPRKPIPPLLVEDELDI